MYICFQTANSQKIELKQIINYRKKKFATYKYLTFIIITQNNNQTYYSAMPLIQICSSFLLYYSKKLQNMHRSDTAKWENILTKVLKGKLTST